MISRIISTLENENSSEAFVLKQALLGRASWISTFGLPDWSFLLDVPSKKNEKRE
jgi:hypothetical protein